ncbi:MAG: hypothetical protein LBS50_01555 [Prevotellaceae bacterium]|nr:hypothetical protein [Prevotellaceae bacterium]
MNDPKSDCYVQPPVVPPVQQHTTTYTFHADDGYAINPTDPRVKQSVDSIEVVEVILEALDSGWDRVSKVVFSVVVGHLENKLAISPKVRADGTMTCQTGGILPEDSLRLVEMGIEIKNKEY